MNFRRCLPLLLLLLVNTVAHAQLPNNWKQGVVRLSSHGISGAIIHTEPGRSLVLSCAHGWTENPAAARTPITVDVPCAEGQQLPASNGRPRLLALDARNDLSLIEIPAGPLPVIPMAPPGHRPSRNIISCGYDEMRWQSGPLVKRATIQGDDGQTTFTNEIPWHGRSGGPLIDADSGHVIGVVQGYGAGPRGEPTGPGMYISQSRIRSFIGGARQGSPQQQRMQEPPPPQQRMAPPPQQQWQPPPQQRMAPPGPMWQPQPPCKH